MNSLRKHRFPGAALAQEQNGDIGRRNLGDNAPERLHGRAHARHETPVLVNHYALRAVGSHRLIRLRSSLGLSRAVRGLCMPGRLVEDARRLPQARSTCFSARITLSVLLSLLYR